MTATQVRRLRCFWSFTEQIEWFVGSFWRQTATMLIKIKKETLTQAVDVILRVPSLFIAEAWYRTNMQSMQTLVYPGRRREVDGTLRLMLKTFYYSTILIAATMAVLPLKRLVTFYMYMVSAALITLAHYLSQMYVDVERTSPSPESVFDDIECIQRLTLHIAGQCFIGASVGYLVNLRQWARLSILMYTAPMIARIFGYPVHDLYRVHNISAMFMLLVVIFYIFHHLPTVFDLIKSGIHHVVFSLQFYGWIVFLRDTWFKLYLPLQFVTFWLVLFALQMLKYIRPPNHPIHSEGWIVVVLASISECCSTPISLTGLCFTVSYVAYVILASTKIYLTGRGGFMHDNVMHQGWTEGFTMFLLAIQTKIIELKTSQRAFLMSIVLFIVCSSLIQSMYEIAEPFLMELSASQNKTISKHVRAVLLCTFLWMFPLYMTFSICQYFDLDFWLLVVISSCILTSVQVLGSLAVYILFIYDSFSNHPWESLDDVVYYAKGTTRVFEFIVAVFVVGYGVKESVFGEWSWVNSSILLVHCYFNVWQRLQAGWKSYLLRREAVKKIEALPVATDQQLKDHNDLCPICFQELLTAIITPCNHYFHAVCLRKWFYVQESCPLCHQKDTDTDHLPGQNGPPQSDTGAGKEEQASPDEPKRHEGDVGSCKEDTATTQCSDDKVTSGDLTVGHSRSSSNHSTEENYIMVDTRQVEGEMEDELNVAKSWHRDSLQLSQVSSGSTITSSQQDDQ